MALLVMLIGITAQKFLHLLSIDYQYSWFERYFGWMAEKVEPVTKGHGLLSLAILLLPMLVIIAVVFSILYHLTGTAGYFLLSVVWFWFCLDARDMKKRPYTVQSPNILLDNAARGLFGVMFWFALFGPVGLALYYMVHCISEELGRLKDGRMQSTLKYATMILSIMDWVPLRLLGLSFALVGQFTKVMRVWGQNFRSGLDCSCKFAETCALAAIDQSEERVSSKLDAMYTLLNHAMYVWLAVIALVTLGIFLS